MSELISINELSKKLGVHRNTIDRRIKDGLPHYKIGKTLRFDLEEVKKWLRSR